MIDLDKLDFFSKLTKEDISKLKSISTQKSYKKGEILFYEGDEPRFLYVLLCGALRVYKTNAKSQQIFLHSLNAITFVAELANFENIPYPASAEFTVDGEVLKIDYERFVDEFISNKQMSLNLVRSLSGKLKILSQVLHDELILSSEAKIAKFIVENAELFNSSKNVNIASILNITPETLSRVLAGMKKDGLVRFDEHKSLIYADEQKLKQIYS